MLVMLRNKSNRRKYTGKLALSEGVAYSVIGIEADDYRILDNDGSPVLFPPYLFTLIDTSTPASWITEVGEEGEMYAYPPEFNGTGFFEDYFDGDKKTNDIFWRVISGLRKEKEK